MIEKIKLAEVGENLRRIIEENHSKIIEIGKHTESYMKSENIRVQVTLKKTAKDNEVSVTKMFDKSNGTIPEANHEFYVLVA